MSDAGGDPGEPGHRAGQHGSGLANPLVVACARASLALLLATLAVAPLVFGAFSAAIWVALLIALCLALVVALFGDAHEGHVALPWPPLVSWLVTVVVVLFVHLTPLPGALTAWLSPAGASSFASAGGGWHAASLDWTASCEAALKSVLYALGFFLAARVSREPAGARAALITLVTVGAFEAFYGLVEQFSGEGRVLGWARPTAVATNRAVGTFANPNHYAGFLAMCIPVALGLAVSQGQDGSALPRGRWRAFMAFVTREDFPKRLIVLSLAIVLAAGLAGSFSRGGLLAAGGGLAVTAVALLRGTRVGRRGALVLVGVAVVLVTLSSLGLERYLERFSGLGQAVTEPKLEARIVYALDSLQIVKSYPLVGVGAGAFDAVYPEFRTAPGDGRVTYAHNDYAQLYVELGVIAATALLLGIALTCRRIWHEVKERSPERQFLALSALSALAPMAIHSWFDFNLHMPANALWVAVLLGTAWGVANPDGVRRLRWPTRPVASRLTAASIVVVISAVALVGFLFARADWEARPGIERFDHDDRPLPVKLECHERAVEIWPYNARLLSNLAAFRWQHARVLEVEGAREAAKAVVGDDAPESILEQLACGIFEARLRTPSRELAVIGQQARDEAQRAVRLAPGDARHRAVLAMIEAERPR